MKKYILILSLLSLFLFTVPVYADTNEHTVIETIDKVYYDSTSHHYFANTVPDETGGFWTIDIEAADQEDIEHTRELERDYRGVSVRIVYVGNLDTDHDIEIISADIQTDAE
jgi:hypothetical protein